MPESLNDYLRQGFGRAMIGSAFADLFASVGGGGAAPSYGYQSGKVKGPRRKMPHALIEDKKNKAA